MKGVSEIISTVLIVVIAIGLASTAYMWGLPLIEKTQGRAAVDDVAASFDQSNSNSLTSQVFSVFSNGGEKNFNIGADGLWTLKPGSGDADSNYIQFSFASKVSNVAADAGWLSSQGACPPAKGVLNNDNFYVICSRADSIKDGYNITYRVYYRELDSAISATGQKINIVPTGTILTSIGKNIRITRGAITQASIGGKTLTLTEIKLLLE
ncbi:hypothetical protein EPN87_03065 [archaeon]|nr:MAG: hypothetical protein EPN87_03065 [archaeon]